ncbi:DNA topoisomerase 1 [Coemansia sp. RSA 552]|nr:DNA topoisomerase 1 [Coemansia sp. RSA 552]
MSSSESDDGVPLSAIVKRNKMANSRRAVDSSSSLSSSSSSSSSDEDNVPLAKRSAMPARSLSSSSLSSSASSLPRIKRKNDTVSESDSESDVPLSNQVRKSANKKSPAATAAKRVKKEPTSTVGSSTTKANGKAKAAPKKAAVKREPAVKKEPGKSSSGSAKKTIVDRKPLIKAESSVSNGSQNSSEVSDDEYRWWLEHKDDGGPKWMTLEHSGVLFPPDYEAHGLPLMYKGKEVRMPPEVEEVATFFAALVGTDHGENKVFQNNFFDDFTALLDRHMRGKHPVKEFKHCDFSRIRAHLDQQSAKRKAMPKAEKEAAKELRQKAEKDFEYCVLDGRREKVGNFRIEPPGLFRGRGAHPKTGRLKTRVMPEQVTINISKGVKIPDPPPGHRWGNVLHDNTVTWLAMWKENINNSTKYVFLAAGSSLKGQSDLRKFEKARKLVTCVDAIRSQYMRELKSEVMAERQRATALYLIDRYALRAGNEKSDDEADTVGCCSLRCEHVKLEPPNIVHFDFLGKDSIRYERTTEVDKQVWKNLNLFKRDPKASHHMLFDRLNTTVLNKHLTKLMPGLTAKVFRTFNASFVFQRQLLNTPKDGTEAEKILAYNRANREVAVLCNHQRSVSKGFEGQMTRIDDKLLAVCYQRLLLRNHLLSISPQLKKKHPVLQEKEPRLTASWIKKHLLATCELDREKAKKKFERDNEKLKEAKEPQLPKSKLNEQLAAIKEREKGIRAKTYVPEPPVAKNATPEKILEKVEKLTQRIRNIEVDKIEKDENKTTALSTSKLNYIDPRISIAWCKKHDVPIEKIFNKTLREKFTWALEVDGDWSF